MSLLTHAYLLDKYGLRLSMDQLAECIGSTKKTIENQVYSGRFPIPTYVDIKHRWVDYRDVAAYMDKLREQAA